MIGHHAHTHTHLLAVEARSHTICKCLGAVSRLPNNMFNALFFRPLLQQPAQSLFTSKAKESVCSSVLVMHGEHCERRPVWPQGTRHSKHSPRRAMSALCDPPALWSRKELGRGSSGHGARREPVSPEGGVLPRALPCPVAAGCLPHTRVAPCVIPQRSHSNRDSRRVTPPPSHTVSRRLEFWIRS